MKFNIMTPQFEALKVGNPSSTWTLGSGEKINLLSLKELREYKISTPETTLICIDGSITRAKDCNEDTRFGYVAYGIKQD